jgi:hypothetical protein
MKLPDSAAQTAKYVNMMNATKQLEAAERQAATAEKRNKREEDLQVPALATARTQADVAKLEYTMKFYETTANDLANSSTPEQAIARGERLKQQFPEPALQKRIDETIDDLVRDPSRFEENRKRILIRTLDAKDQFAETHSDIFDAKGKLLSKVTSPIGAFPTRITPSRVTNLQDTAGAPAPAPAPKTPVGPTAAPQQTTPGPVPTGKFGETRVIPDSAVPLTDFEQEDIRRIKEGSGMTNTPASFNSGSMGTPTAGQMSPDMVPALIDSAVKTGVMAQIDLDQMLALAPPQARQGIVDVLRSNNVSLQADAPSLVTSGMGQQPPMAANPVQRPQSQFADMRGPAPQASFADLGGQPQMQNTMAQYKVGDEIYGRDPRMAPYPGSAQVPLSRVGAEARVQRAPPEEEAAKTRAVGEATAAVEFNKKAAEKLPGRKQVSTLINKVRAAYEALDKAEAIPSETRGGFANAMDYFGTSSLGREAQKMVGTTSSKYLSEIINSRKLLATAIKNATGMSAQEMNSNVELQLTLDALTDPTQGIEAARTTLNTLEELYGAPRTAAPAAAPRAVTKTPVIPKAAIEMLRKNPSPKQGAMFDRVFGKGAAAKVLGQR